MWITPRLAFKLGGCQARKIGDRRSPDRIREEGILVTAMWQQCLGCLQDELPTQQFETWIRPLQLEAGGDQAVRLVAPNRFIQGWVADHFLERIRELIAELTGSAARVEVTARTTTDAFMGAPAPFGIGVETKAAAAGQPDEVVRPEAVRHMAQKPGVAAKPTRPAVIAHKSNLNKAFRFDAFVEGKSNQMALAAAKQVSQNPGGAYNPLFIYGGVGLGKTHLMHAVGNRLREHKPGARIVYLHSERFVADMVKALQLNAINEFKSYYRSVDALLIDDIQFFAKKDRSQEEFFHTFNALLEGGQQMILTSDRYPKEIDGVEERLKSRFGWGLTVAVEPPELETRVAILIKKAEQAKTELSNQAAFFIAQRLRSNVRELEGALKRVTAHAQFTGRPIDIELVRDALKDLFALQDRLVTIDNIQRTVAEYYKLKMSDMMSKRRSRSVARPRQVAMYLAKELTTRSLPEIGDVFGGRDHTTVLHACRKIMELKETNKDIQEDLRILIRLLTN